MEVFFQHPFFNSTVGYESYEAENLVFSLLVDVFLRVITKNDTLQVETLELNWKHEITFTTFTSVKTKTELHDKNSSGIGSTSLSSHSDDSRAFISYELELLKRKLEIKEEEEEKLDLILQEKKMNFQRKKLLLSLKTKEIELLKHQLNLQTQYKQLPVVLPHTAD